MFRFPWPEDHAYIYVVSEPYYGGDLTTCAQRASQNGVTLNQKLSCTGLAMEYNWSSPWSQKYFENLQLLLMRFCSFCYLFDSKCNIILILFGSQGFAARQAGNPRVTDFVMTVPSPVGFPLSDDSLSQRTRQPWTVYCFFAQGHSSSLKPDPVHTSWSSCAIIVT